QGRFYKFGDQFNHISRANKNGRNVHATPIEFEMTMIDHLPGLRATIGKTGGVNDIVYTALEEIEKILTGVPGLRRGFFEINLHLFFSHSKHETTLLFLIQLAAIFTFLRKTVPMHAGSGRFSF